MTNYYSDQLESGRLFGWYVYIVAEDGGEYTKIGSALNYHYRTTGLKNGNARPLLIKAIWKFTSRQDARAVEKCALGTMGSSRIPRRDWCRGHYLGAIDAVEKAIFALNAQAEEVVI